MDLADRLAQIADNPDWPPIYRMEAKEGLADRTGNALNPASLSDDDLRAALHARITAREPDPAPKLSLAQRAQANADMADQMALAAIGDHPDAPTPADLRTVLVAAAKWAKTGLYDDGVWFGTDPAGRWADTHGLTRHGQITDRGRTLLDILDRAAALRAQADQTEGN